MAKCGKIWEIEGAVDPAVGAKRVSRDRSHDAGIQRSLHQLRGRFANPVVIASQEHISFLYNQVLYCINRASRRLTLRL